MDQIRDVVAFLSDAYWAAGFLVVAGGFVLFVVEVISKRPRRSESPRVVSISTEASGAAGKAPRALATRPGPGLEAGPPPRALPPGSGARKADSDCLYPEHSGD